MNVTINLMTEFEDIPNEVSHLLKFVQDELVFTSKRAANVGCKRSTLTLLCTSGNLLAISAPYCSS